MQAPFDKSSPETYSAVFLKARRQFIHLWGEMASHWGISKTMAQIFALLFSTPYPMDTDSIMEELFISRGNAHINLKKLIEWGLVRKLEKIDARRDFYIAEKDIWVLTINIIQHRQNQEIFPIAEAIQNLLQSLKTQTEKAPPSPSINFPTNEQLLQTQLEDLLLVIQKLNLLAEIILPILMEKDWRRLDTVFQKLQQA
ncbi:MAG: hypothetical protein RML72_09065 [Bacteroidia bacterium]|nr:hypothetical protein [Bacteroidia bacterium]MDW8159006.1 hypothetical protein [Bacteroidia bacterium]